MTANDNTPAVTGAPAIEHEMVVEIEYQGGGRRWSKPMPASEVSAYIKQYEEWGDTYSDSDCTTTCMHPDHDSNPDHVRWREEEFARRAANDL